MTAPDASRTHATVLRDRLDEPACAAVLALVEQAAEEDGTPALNEQALLNLRAGSATPSRDVRHLLACTGPDATGALAGYAQLDTSTGPAGTVGEVTAQCVVNPAHRRRGWGSALVVRALREVAGSPLLMWSHGDHPAAAVLARSLGFVRARELRQLRRRLGTEAPALPGVRLPDGVRVRTFRVGVDERAWLALNARAFAGHPEQGGMGVDDLAARIAAGWFDPAGFFLAERTVPDGEPRLVGFHWTKVHGGGAHRHPALGEVYVVGVDPAEQGSGLGSALTAIGLQHLANKELSAVLLYVEADNAAALRVYERLGFTHVGTDTQYRHPG